MEGIQVPVSAFVSVCTGAKLRHGGRGAYDFCEWGIENLIEIEGYTRFENADYTPEWLCE